MLINIDQNELIKFKLYESLIRYAFSIFYIWPRDFMVCQTSNHVKTNIKMISLIPTDDSNESDIIAAWEEYSVITLCEQRDPNTFYLQISQKNWFLNGWSKIRLKWEATLWNFTRSCINIIVGSTLNAYLYCFLKHPYAAISKSSIVAFAITNL